MNGIYLYFVNKHRSRWPLLGLQYTDNLPISKSVDRRQPARTAQADQVNTFRNSHKVPFSRDVSHLLFYDIGMHCISRYCLVRKSIKYCRGLISVLHRR